MLVPLQIIEMVPRIAQIWRFVHLALKGNYHLGIIDARSLSD